MEVAADKLAMSTARGDSVTFLDDHFLLVSDKVFTRMRRLTAAPVELFFFEFKQNYDYFLNAVFYIIIYIFFANFRSFYRHNQAFG